MIREKDLKILHHLRNNSRETLTSMSRKLDVPVTTVYDRLLANERKYIKRHTSLIDFQKLGLNSSMYISFRVSKYNVDSFEKFLKMHHSINSAYKLDFDGSYLIELISENSADANRFVKELENNFGVNRLQLFTIIEELQREAILTKPEHVMKFSAIG